MSVCVFFSFCSRPKLLIRQRQFHVGSCTISGERDDLHYLCGEKEKNGTAMAETLSRIFFFLRRPIREEFLVPRCSTFHAPVFYPSHALTTKAAGG